MNLAFVKKNWGVGEMRIIFKESRGYSPRRNRICGIKLQMRSLKLMGRNYDEEDSVST